MDAAGNPRMGNFVVTVDDGSGTPSASLLSTVTGAIEAVRPVGSTFTVQPPVVVTVNVSLTITVSAAAVKTQVTPLVSAAIGSYINSLPIGTILPMTKLAQLAYDASPSIVNASQLLINGATADISPGTTGVVKAGFLAVN